MLSPITISTRFYPPKNSPHLIAHYACAILSVFSSIFYPVPSKGGHFYYFSESHTHFRRNRFGENSIRRSSIGEISRFWRLLNFWRIFGMFQNRAR